MRMKGSIVKKHVGNTGGMRDRYEYTRRNNLEKAQMNLDKIFISKFRNIRLSAVCDRLNISYHQARSLNLNAKDIHKLKVELDRLIREMYDIKNYEGYDLSKNYSYYRWSKDRNDQIESGKRILLRKDCYEDELTEE